MILLSLRGERSLDDDDDDDDDDTDGDDDDDDIPALYVLSLTSWIKNDSAVT